MCLCWLLTLYAWFYVHLLLKETALLSFMMVYILMLNGRKPQGLRVSQIWICMRKAFKPLATVAGEYSRKCTHMHTKINTYPHYNCCSVCVCVCAYIINIFPIFRKAGYRGNSLMLRGESDFPTAEYWSWSSGHVKSVKRCPSCRHCSRRNVGKDG